VRKGNGEKRRESRRENRRFFRPRKGKEKNPSKEGGFFKIHPLFLLVGVWYCFKGELFVFFMSCLVAVQHECAHAFASAKLGYKLNRIVLMPFGAVIDGDLKGISLKDEIIVALWGPLCNLITAGFFVALWWITPDTYAFTDTACFTSLAIGLVNLLPAYPLDGGRILRCVLARALTKRYGDEAKAERCAIRVCRCITLGIAFLGVTAFTVLLFSGERNFSLLPFSIFLLVGAFGNKNNPVAYGKIAYSCVDAIKKGVEIRRVAVSVDCPIKNALRYVSRGSYLVLEVYDERARKLFEIPQNELDEYFALAPTPYTPLKELYQKTA